MTDVPERHELGANDPPPDADPLAERLAKEHADLVDSAADLELRACTLPDRADTEEDCALLIDFVADAKKVVKKASDAHTEEKAPYLRSGRTVDAFFKDVWTPLEARIASLSGKVNAYQRAKAERERAERLERERIEREAAEAQRRAEEEARRAAAEAEERARAEAARIRSAADAQEREEAERRMREASQEAAAQRTVADEAGKDAAKSERVADAHGKAATGSVGKLAKVTSGGASAPVSTFMNHRIVDGALLEESLGPLGPFLPNDAILQAITAAKRQHVAAGTLDGFTIPGVEFFEDSRTTIRTARS